MFAKMSVEVDPVSEASACMVGSTFSTAVGSRLANPLIGFIDDFVAIIFSFRVQHSFRYRLHLRIDLDHFV